jgi:flagellar operon protein
VSVEFNPALLGGRASVQPASTPVGSPQKAGGLPVTGRSSGTGNPPGPSFADALKEASGGTGGAEPLHFSKHALERVQRRGIALDPATLSRLREGVGRAASKGSRNSIVLVDGTAFVVAVPNRTVVTAVGSEHMREHVFTNIDSAVIA